MKYYYLLLFTTLFCSCLNTEEKDNQNTLKLDDSLKKDTILFNDLLLELEEYDGLPINYLNENNEEKMDFFLNDTFKIEVEYSPKFMYSKDYKFTIIPISKGFKLIKSLSKNIFLATINEQDVIDVNQVLSVFDVLIESDDVVFKVKDGQKLTYYYSNKEVLRQKLLKFRID